MRASAQRACACLSRRVWAQAVARGGADLPGAERNSDSRSGPRPRQRQSMAEMMAECATSAMVRPPGACAAVAALFQTPPARSQNCASGSAAPSASDATCANRPGATCGAARAGTRRSCLHARSRGALVHTWLRQASFGRRSGAKAQACLRTAAMLGRRSRGGADARAPAPQACPPAPPSRGSAARPRPAPRPPCGRRRAARPRPPPPSPARAAAGCSAARPPGAQRCPSEWLLGRRMTCGP